MRARRAPPDEPRLYPQARPAGNDRLRVDPVDHDELLAAGRAGHEPDRSARDVELIGEETEERLVRCSGHGRGRHVRPEDPVDHAVDMVGSGSRCQSDGEANLGVRQDSEQAQQKGEDDQDDQRRQVEGPRRREGPPDRAEDRLGRRVDEPAEL